MNKKISTKAGIAIVVAAAVIVGAIVWIVLAQQAQAPAQSPQANSLKGQMGNQNVALDTTNANQNGSSQQNQLQTASSGNTTTYKNDQWGIQFNYPKTWTIDKERSTANEVVFNPPNIDKNPESHESLSYQKNTKNLSLDKIATEMILSDPTAIYKKSYLTIAGERALKEDSGEFATTYYVFLHKEKVYMIMTQGEFTNQIISSIKFTK